MAKHGATREAREARKLAAGHPALISLPLDAWQYEPKQVRSGTTAGRLCPCVRAKLGVAGSTALLPAAWTAAAACAAK